MVDRQRSGTGGLSRRRKRAPQPLPAWLRTAFQWILGKDDREAAAIPIGTLVAIPLDEDEGRGQTDGDLDWEVIRIDADDPQRATAFKEVKGMGVTRSLRVQDIVRMNPHLFDR